MIRPDELDYIPPLRDYLHAHPRHLHYDPKHESPTLIQTAISSLIVSDWKSLFAVLLLLSPSSLCFLSPHQGKTFDELDLNGDGVLTHAEVLQSLTLSHPLPLILL